MSIQTVLEERLSEVNRESPRFQAVQTLISCRRELESSHLNPETIALIDALRKHGAAIASEQQFPSKRDEDWRFTDISPLLKADFAPVTVSSQDLTLDITPFILPEASQSRLVFVNGVYSPSLSDLSALPSGTVTHLLSGEVSEPQLNAYLGKQPGTQEVFTALNTASLSDAAVVWAKGNQEIETPIHLLFISLEEEDPAIANPRCLVVAQDNSQLTLIEQYLTIRRFPNASGVTPYFTNSVTEIWLENNARVNHTRIQQEGQPNIHIGKTVVSQNQDSQYTINGISFGAGLSRHNLEVFHYGEGIETTLNGLTEITGKQVADTHSIVNHLHPNCTSTQLHKCIVDKDAHAVFNGKVFVPQPAQLTNANQLNRNLLLSKKAKVDTKPELQITADNVKCSHGATVSQLQEDEMFYLQSRGLSKDASRYLLIDAFAYDILDRIPLKSLKTTLSQCLSCRTYF